MCIPLSSIDINVFSIVEIEGAIFVISDSSPKFLKPNFSAASNLK